MTITPSNVRTAFPALADTTKYPDQTMQFWIDAGYRMFSAAGWGDSLDLAITLWTSHNTVLAARAGTAGALGSASGALQSAAVDKVSKSYDTKFGINERAGWYNLTPYGQQLYMMMSAMGGGIMYVLPDAGGPTSYRGF